MQSLPHVQSSSTYPEPSATNVASTSLRLNSTFPLMLTRLLQDDMKRGEDKRTEGSPKPYWYNTYKHSMGRSFVSIREKMSSDG